MGVLQRLGDSLRGLIPYRPASPEDPNSLGAILGRALDAAREAQSCAPAYVGEPELDTGSDALPEGFYADESGDAGLHANITDDSAPIVERDGKQFARAADGAEIEVPVDPSGFPGVTQGANGWEALIAVEDGAPIYGPQDAPNASASPYRETANRLNTAAPEPAPANPASAQDPWAEFKDDGEPVAAKPRPREADVAAMRADMPELAKYADEGPEAAADVQATLDRVGEDYPYQQALFDIRQKHGKGQQPQPLLADPTEAERGLALGRLEPSDLLPIAATRVAGVDEAAGIEAGRYPPVKAPNERAELASRNLPSPVDGLKTIPKRGPVDLVTWLRTQGGLKPQDSSLSHAGITNRARLGVDFAEGEHRFGKLIDPDNGMAYDEAARAAWEAGYFPDHPVRPSISEFLDALIDTHAGRSRAFLPDDLEEVDRFNAARSQRSAVEAAKQDGAPLVEDRGQPVTMDDLEANAAPVRAYEEWGENAPDFAGNIRLDGLDSPQSIKRALVRVDQVNGGFDAARRGRITHAETEALAADLGMTPRDLLKRRKGQALNAEQALAARQILAKSGNELVNLSKRLTAKIANGDATEAEMVAFREALVRHAAIQEQVAGASAEAGRALSQFRMVADARAVRGEVLRSLIDGSGGPDGIEAAARMIVQNADDPKRLNAIAKAQAAPTLKDKVIEIWYNFLLSGPRTHAVNITSNFLTSVAQIPEHAVAAMIGAPRALVQGAAADRVMFTETGARVIGWLQGTREGLAHFARTMRTGEPSDLASKVEAQSMRAVSGVKGSVLRTPTRLLMAEDELFKAMARRMEVAGLAVREARKGGLRGDDARTRAAELMANPTPEILEQAAEYGRYLTFQRKLGKGGQSVSQLTTNNPWLKLFIPFTRTPINLLKFAAERSVAAPILGEWRADIRAGGARRDLAMARVAVGTGAAALAVEATRQGILTGGGPADESAKRMMIADGWQPYSVRVGDTYYSYQRLDPFSTTLGLAADYVDLQSHMTAKEQEQVAAVLTGSILQNLSSKSWLSGMSNLGEALSDWGRYGDNFVASLAGSSVPAVVGQVAGAVDPVQREAKTMLDRIRARIPGASKGLPARRDVFGQEQEAANGGGFAAFSPVFTKERRNDPTIKALIDAGVTFGSPSRTIGDPDNTGQKIELTPEQFSFYQQSAGQIAKPLLDELINAPDWETMQLEDRQAAVREIIEDARADAREMLLSQVRPKPRPKAQPPGVAGLPDPWMEFPDAGP